MANMPAKIVIGRGPSPQQEYTLEQGETTIGRAADNVIVVLDPEVSRRHARILREGSLYTLEDWGSTNGTFLNGQRVTRRTALQNGDRIALGDVALLTFHDTAVSEQPTAIIPPAAQTPSEADTPGTQPETAVTPEVPSQSTAEPRSEFPELIPAAPAAPTRRRRTVFTCGCMVLLVVLCAATFYFLDAYQQGRLLYCGPLRPLFEIILGPFGFAPVCP